MSHLHLARQTCFAMACLFAASLVAAADPPAKAPKTSTRDELRACLAVDDELKDRQIALKTEFTDVQAALAANQAETARLNEEMTLVDKKDEKAVGAFNAKLGDHNIRAAEINARSAAFNVKRDTFEADVEAHGQRCASNVYKTEDRNAVMKERQKPAP